VLITKIALLQNSPNHLANRPEAQNALIARILSVALMIANRQIIQ
jgi:hypothetical protein